MKWNFGGPIYYIWAPSFLIFLLKEHLSLFLRPLTWRHRAVANNCQCPEPGVQITSLLDGMIAKQYLRLRKRSSWTKKAAIFRSCPTMNNSPAFPRLQRLHNSQSIRMRGAILQITVNNNLPPSAPLPSLKQCFIALFFAPLSHLHLPSPRSTVWSLPTSACLPRAALTCWLAAVIRHMVGRSIDRSPPRTKADLWGFFPSCLSAPKPNNSPVEEVRPGR